MIHFLLNDTLITTDENPGSTLLDFVRYNRHLVGTKIGCREGDCGACTVLVGTLSGGKMSYKSLTSCITPLGNVTGKHVVTIEGLNMHSLSPYQQAMVDESGQQCGFCTVGFIVSFAGECLSEHATSYESVIRSIDGNICRCTGYKSIERAAKTIYNKLLEKDKDEPIQWLVNNGFIPKYFLNVPEKIAKLATQNSTKFNVKSKVVVAGGTDLLVQKHDAIYESTIDLISDDNEFSGIELVDDYIIIKGGTNTSALLHSKLMNDAIPNLQNYIKLVSSTPIRNIATVAGNFVNASPIADLTAFFIALNSEIEFVLSNGVSRRIKLKNFYLDYKKLDRQDDEIISKIYFKLPLGVKFNFEKISKRRYLDIATVNTGMSIVVSDNFIKEVHVSAGGVGPVPMYLQATCDYLLHKELNHEHVKKASQVLENEISAISDVRGSKEYKSLALRQLFFAHFIDLFPEHFNIKSLI